MKFLLMAATFSFISVVNCLPLKTHANADVKSEGSKEDELKFMKELEKLKDYSGDKAVVHLKQVDAVNINGDKAAETKEAVKVEDPKSGKVIGSLVKTKTENNGEKPKETIEVQGPAEKKNVKMDAPLQGEPISPEEVAEYLMETGDISSFKEALNEQVLNNKMSRDDAENYAGAVRNVMMQLKNLNDKEETDKEEELDDTAIAGMIEVAFKLNQLNKWKAQLYSLTKYLYIRANAEGDDKARTNLNQFAQMIKNEAEEGNIDSDLENELYDIILLAISDVDNEMAHVEADEPGEEDEELDLQNVVHQNE